MVQFHVNYEGIKSCVSLCHSNTEITRVIAVCNVQPGLKTLKQLHNTYFHKLNSLGQYTQFHIDRKGEIEGVSTSVLYYCLGLAKLS